MMTAGAIAALLLLGTAAHAAPGDDGWQYVKNWGTNACLGAAPENTTVIEECDASRSQHWKVQELVSAGDGVYRLRKNNVECAELTGTYEYAELTLRTCDRFTPYQQFRLQRTGREFNLISEGNGHWLKVDDLGGSPYTSSERDWPGDYAVWSFHPYING